MCRANKVTIYILCFVISFFSCYALYKLIEASLVILEKSLGIDNVAAGALSLIFAPILLFIFNLVFYLVLYEKTIKPSPRQIVSWRILLLSKKHWRLNLSRVLMYLLCLWIIADHIGMVSIWVVITLVLNILAYGYWTLQIVGERYLFN
ncbi:hypothetical protein DS745_03925 [Anaerobacillus alkaliphilus]|uniref:Uncharacterized protein n=1 Tax=Anaerobacillus alkaliphilus TaxID=1548597 RepID=A0A4Q0W1V4_9BACI|nr:hypothetical protein DS745_03925 [Anaerobacillus alkaliphilus]